MARAHFVSCGVSWCRSVIDGRPCPRSSMSVMPKSERRVPRFGWSEDSSEPTLPHNIPQSRDELIVVLAEYLGDQFFAGVFADCIDLIRKKNADYSQGEQKGDRIAAFRRIAKDTGITMEQAWAVFCQKHWGAVMKYVKQGTVESEPIDGRIHDIINYCVLLAAIIDDQKESE